MHCREKGLTTVKFCEKELQINHEIAVDWKNYKQEVSVNNVFTNRTVIGGPGRTVKIDESFFG